MRHRNAAVLLFCLFTFLFVRAASAQSSGAPAGAAVIPPPLDSAQGGALDSAQGGPTLTHGQDGQTVVHATRIAEPLRIDGVLDEEAYTHVAPITEFLQQEPISGAPVSERTEVWVLFDDKNIYVTCRCWEQHPDRIVANDMRRDSSNFGSQDHIGVVFDTFHDRRNGFLFNLSPVGGMRDGSTTENAPNFDWNTVWEAKASRFEGGWIAEMAIPFKSLRYASGRSQVWGIQIRREMRSKNEHVYLTKVSQAWGPAAIHHVSAAATLVDLEVPPVAVNLEVKPYGISRLTTDLTSRPPVHGDVQSDWGIDAKYGLTKSLTADFTYNTDFAQVEADEAQVNLTRFNLNFPEKREFFLEGHSIFAFGTAGAAGASADTPTIFYTRRIGLNGATVVPVTAGGRLTGKAGPWSIGALNMETGDVLDAKLPETNFTVVRVRRDVLRRSTIGGVFTRRAPSSTSSAENDVWGVDANFTFYQNVTFAGYLAGSHSGNLHGDDLSYDTLFNYAGDRYGLILDRAVMERNFNPDVGFVRRLNFRRNYAQARFSPRTMHNPIVRKWTYQGSVERVVDDAGRLQFRVVNAQFQSDFHSSDQISVQHVRTYEFLPAPFLIATNVRIPAGGYDYQNTIASFSAGQQHRFSGTPSVEIGTLYGGTKKTLAYRGRVKITNQLGVEPNISLNWIDLPQGPFRNTVFGARTTFTMTPRMFVAVFSQYSSSTTSVLTNVRFRWEYLPGSELFVVYTEGRSTLPPQGTDLQNRGLVVKINRLFRF